MLKNEEFSVPGTTHDLTSEVLDVCGLLTPAARGLMGVLAHPLAAHRDTIVVQQSLADHDEEFEIVRLSIAAGCDAVCIADGADVDGSGPLFVVQVGDEDAWIGYARAFADSNAAQAVLVPIDDAHDMHLVMDVDGKLQRRAGRPATHPAFGHRLAAARLRKAAASRDGAARRAA